MSKSFSELKSGKNLQNILGDLTPPCSSPLQILALPTPTLTYWWPLAPLSLAIISWTGPASLRAPSAHGTRTKLNIASNWQRAANHTGPESCRDARKDYCRSARQTVRCIDMLRPI
jgi:hypothetical protein